MARPTAAVRSPIGRDFHPPSRASRTSAWNRSRPLKTVENGSSAALVRQALAERINKRRQKTFPNSTGLSSKEKASGARQLFLRFQRRNQEDRALSCL